MSGAEVCEMSLCRVFGESATRPFLAVGQAQFQKHDSQNFREILDAVRPAFSGSADYIFGKIAIIAR